MSVIDVPRRAEAGTELMREVLVDLRRLRDWGTAEGSIGAGEELDRVRGRLAAEGIPARSVDRVVAAVARYAFLVGGDCALSARVLWRLHAVDGVPARVLAGLQWRHVRLRLREIAFTDDSGIRYCSLSQENARLLAALRDRARSTADRSRVFVDGRGVPWDEACLGRALSSMSGR
jgi:hypothetical protein